MSYQLWVFFSIIGWGVGSFFYKIAGNHLHPLMITSIVTCLYVLVTPLAFIFLKFNHAVNSPGIAFAILGGIFTCVGSLGYFFALRAGGGAGITATLTALYPALTLGLSCLFLGEPFSLKKGIGMIFALISFIILSQN